MIEQKWINIGSVNVPIIIEDGDEWFPISYISEKVLLLTNKLIHKKNEEKYISYIKECKIQYSKTNTQKTKCINKDGLILLISSIEVGRHNVDQRKRQNYLRRMLNLNEVSEKEFLINALSIEEINKYDLYTKDVVMEFIKNHNVDKYQLCHGCDKYFPQDGRFFSKDNRADFGYSKKCRICLGYSDIFSHDRREVKEMRINNKYNKEISERNPVYAYIEFMNGNLSRLPTSYINKDDYLKIIKHLYKTKQVSKKEISINLFYEKFKLGSIHKILTIDEINRFLFGEKYYLKSWEFDYFFNFKLNLSTLDYCEMLKNYLKHFKIKEKDITKINFIKCFDDMHILNKVKETLAEIVLACFDNKYPCYRFTQLYNYKTKYYKKKENRINDMKFFIEQDLKVPLEKIPLYITLNTIQKNNKSLYNMIKKYYKNLFEIINECYPEKFVEYDFVINSYRDEFDSKEEEQINDVLKNYFENVIYNDRKSQHAIKFKGMIPDWIIITEKNCWIIEYFGMYIVKSDYNKRIKNYIEKTHEKINKYNNICHKKMFLYPEDLSNGMEGLYKKISEID